GQVCLVQENDVRSVEHHGILLRFLRSFGHAANHHSQAFAKIVGSGADQVAHVFDDQQIESLHGKLDQCAGDHPCVQMTHGPRSNLVRSNTVGANSISIKIRLKVPLNHSHTIAAT